MPPRSRLIDMAAVDELLELERARESRRAKRNRWLVVLLVVVVLFAAFATWGVMSQRAAQDRFDRVHGLTDVVDG